MPKFDNFQLASMSRPASDTEEVKMQHAIDAVKKALNASDIIDSKYYTVFGQGSYANNTNVRQNSDVDVNVCYTSAFFYQIPDNANPTSYGFTDPSQYTYWQFKNDVEKMLVSYFGEGSVVRKNKCLHVKSNTYRVECDVVPTWEYRRYKNRSYYDEGVKLFSDRFEEVINFPKQHIANGIQKNDNTKRRYKRLARILKNLNYRMQDERYYTNPNITSFLLECLAYNLPNVYYELDTDCDWNSIIRDAICYFYNGTKSDATVWQQWTEVSELLPLMYSHKWQHTDVNEFMVRLWNYLQYQ